MKTRALAMSLLFALAATPALAQTSPPANAAAPGLLRIDVDARDLARRIFKVTATVPATPPLATRQRAEERAMLHPPAPAPDPLPRPFTAHPVPPTLFQVGTIMLGWPPPGN